MRIAVDGTTLYAEEHGSGPPLLLLEGMGGDVPGWRRTIPHYDGFRVVMFDFRGSGWSDRPAERYSMEMFVSDTIRVMDELRIESAHLYGQSMGGMVALNVVLAHSGRVRSLVLACTHAGGSSVVPASPDPEDRGSRVLYARAFFDANPDHVTEDLAASRSVPPPREDLQRYVAEGHDVAGRLGDIRRPVLVVHGTDDRVVHPDNSRLLSAGIPGAELLMVEGAGHLLHSERAGEVDLRIAGFLRLVDSGAGA